MDILSRRCATWHPLGSVGGYYSSQWTEEEVHTILQSVKAGEDVAIYVNPGDQDPYSYKNQFEWVRKYGGVPVFVFYSDWHFRPDDEANFRDNFDVAPLYEEHVKIISLGDWQRLGGPWYG